MEGQNGLVINSKIENVAQLLRKRT